MRYEGTAWTFIVTVDFATLVKSGCEDCPGSVRKLLRLGVQRCTSFNTAAMHDHYSAAILMDDPVFKERLSSSPIAIMASYAET